MKKTVILLLAVLMLAGLCACGEDSPAAPDMQERFEALQQVEGTPEMLVVPPGLCDFLCRHCPGGIVPGRWWPSARTVCGPIVTG